MASGIAVTPERLREIAERMSKGAADVQAIVSALAGNVAPIRSEWAGSAQMRFDDLWDQLQRDAQSVQSVLTVMAKLSATAAAASEGNDTTFARTLDQFSAELDRLSDLLGPARDRLSGAGADRGTVDDHPVTEADATAIDEDLADHAVMADAGGLDAAHETVRPRWARFMTPTAWREIEAGNNWEAGNN
jgi:WXG100 family type VII secretion target